MLDILKSLGIGLTFFSAIAGTIFAITRFTTPEHLFIFLGVVVSLCLATAVGGLIRMMWEGR